MNNFSRKIITAFVLTSTLVGFQAKAEIQTSTIGRDVENLPPSELKTFTGSTPCYIKWSKENKDAFMIVAKKLKEGGFNITADENAACVIEITGYLTTPSKTSGSVPVNFIYVLNHKDSFSEIAPALKIGDRDENGNIVKNANGLTNDTVGASGLNNISQVGNAINGAHGSVVGVALGTLVNIFSSVQSRQETPPGLVYINAVVMFDGWLPGTKRPAFVLGAYAASTTQEMPEALIDAGVKRVAQAIWEHTAAYDRANGIEFTMPALTEPGAETRRSRVDTAQKTTESAAGTDQNGQGSIKAITADAVQAVGK